MLIKKRAGLHFFLTVLHIDVRRLSSLFSLLCFFCGSITVVAFTPPSRIAEVSKTARTSTSTTVAAATSGGVASVATMEVWCGCGGPALSSNSDCLSVAKRYNFDALLLEDTRDLSAAPDYPGGYARPPSLIARRGKRLYDAGTSSEDKEKEIGIVVDIDHGAEQQDAMAAMGSVEWILVYCGGDWKMIPAENLIVAARASGTKLAFRVNREEDVVGFSRALELGVDALLVSYEDDANVVRRAIQARDERRNSLRKNDDGDVSNNDNPPSLPEIVTGSCWRPSSNSVLADRVCVDLVQSLRSSEGCWVGSSAKVLALVLSEAAASQFVPSRPFRVNAGPVHSYILMADGTTTKYLSELQAGDEVLVYDAETGESRPVAIGRLKIEIRPCVQVTLSATTGDGGEETKRQEAQVFLQQAETVRLGQKCGGDGNGDDSFARVTELKICSKDDDEAPAEKDSVLLRVSGQGTHIGRAYAGKVEEL